MKKILLAALLTLSSLGAANAATFNATQLIVGTPTTINFTETRRFQYFQFETAGQTSITFDLTSPAFSLMTFTLWEDRDGSSTNGTIDVPEFGGDSFALINSNFNFLDNLSVTFASLPGATNYALRIAPQVIGRPDGTATMTVNSVPVPAAAWLFGSALLGFFGMRKRQAV